MAVKVLILEDNPVARSFLCRVVRESFSDVIAITEAGDLESARRTISLTGGAAGCTASTRSSCILVDLELPDGNGMELLGELAQLPGHQDRHHAVLRRRPPVPGAAMRRRRLPAEGRPLRGAGRGTAEDRARPTAVVAGHRAPAADAFPARRQRRRRRPPDSGFSTAGAFQSSRPVPIEKPLDHERLTPRESEVLTYLSKGFTIKEIASPDGHQVVHRQRPHQVHLQEAQRVQPRRSGRAGQQAGAGVSRSAADAAARTSGHDSTRFAYQVDPAPTTQAATMAMAEAASPRAERPGQRAAVRSAPAHVDAAARDCSAGRAARLPRPVRC